MWLTFPAGNILDKTGKEVVMAGNAEAALAGCYWLTSDSVLPPVPRLPIFTPCAVLSADTGHFMRTACSPTTFTRS